MNSRRIALLDIIMTRNSWISSLRQDSFLLWGWSYFSAPEAQTLTGAYAAAYRCDDLPF